MTTPPPIDERVVDRCRETVPAEAASDTHGNGRQGVNDLMLVFGVAAVVLGVVIVSQSVLSPQSALPRVPPTYAVPGVVERLVSAQDAHPGTTMPATQTASRGVTKISAACPLRPDVDHDWRQVLAAMALQRRRTMHSTAHGVPPATQDIPAQDRALARAKASVARGEASPQPVRPTIVPGC